jgi:hypothetical protein
MFSDAYRLEDIEGVAYQFKGKWITKASEDFGVACNVDEAAPEGATADIEKSESQARVINVLDAHGLVEQSFDKKSFLGYFKDYLATLKKQVIEPRFGGDATEIKNWQDKFQKVFKEQVLDKFADFQFYSGQSMNPEGMILLMRYLEDGETPCFLAWKDGLREVKY